MEKIVDKARLIADMMWRIQSKIKDSNLRHIDDYKKGPKNNLLDNDEEETKNDSPYQARSKRNRINSISGMNFSSAFGKPQLPPSAFASISAALGGEDGYPRFEAKKRGMSDVDDMNIQQAHNNAHNMIQ